MKDFNKFEKTKGTGTCYRSVDRTADVHRWRRFVLAYYGGKVTPVVLSAYS